MFQLISLLLTVVAIYLMISTKKNYKEVSQEPLTVNEKIIIWIICFFTPIWGGAIFYYGWRKLLPIKAKKANNISLWVFLIEIILFIGLIFMSGVK
jgi:hypothetical protein